MTGKEEREQAKWLLNEIERLLRPQKKTFRFMEVCGTHTVEIFRAGLRQLLPECVELVSGPGCPVCVTPDSYMDKAIAYAAKSEVIIATFGDMLKVPGSSSSLAEAQADGADVRIVYSPLDSIQLAKENPDKKIIFLAVGFETTAPAEAAAVYMARQQRLKNYFLLAAPKLVPPAMELLLADDCRPDGFLLPGHVAVVIGTEPFKAVLDRYEVPGVVAGFEPLQILRAIYEMAAMLAKNRPEVVNAYPGVVKPDGNMQARQLMQEVFSVTDAEWRGLGMLEQSGLKLSTEYRDFDIEEMMPVSVTLTAKKSACRCGEVLRGRITPPQCPLFGKVCTPLTAKGPCMVSVEGVCAAWYKYGRGRFRYGAK